MPYTFSDATLLSYNLSNNFLGEGLSSLNSKKNISIRGILDNRLSNLDSAGVAESIKDINDLSSGAFDINDSIFINGYNLGTGRIISVNFPNNNPVRIGEYEYEIEITSQSDLSYYPSDTKYGTYLNTIKDNLLNLDETFNFDYQSDGKCKYIHNVNIQYEDNKSNVVEKAKDLASNLFKDNISLGLISPFSGIYKDFRNKKNYYNEVYNLIDKSCSFTKEIIIDPSSNQGYGLTISHNLSYDTNGKIKVQEDGIISSIDDTTSFTAQNYLNEVLSNSYQRCQSIISNYASKYSLSNTYDGLYNRPYQFGRLLDPSTNTLRYTIAYVNDLSFEGNLINNYTITINKDIRGMINYVENGQIIKVGQLGSVQNLNDIKLKYQEAQSRSLVEYPTFKLLGSALSFAQSNNLYENNFSYTLEKTNDGSVIENSQYYKSLNIKVDDKKPVPITREYIIANKMPKNMLFLYGNNIEIGERLITIEGTLVRPNVNIWNGPRTMPLDNLKSLAIARGLDLISSEAFIDNISYQYTSENNFSFYVSIKYLKRIDG